MALITVKSARADDQVVLWEKNPEHPLDAFGNREAFIAGATPVQVADTPLVLLKIREGQLERVESSAATRSSAAADRARAEAEKAAAEKAAAERAEAERLAAEQAAKNGQ